MKKVKIKGDDLKLINIYGYSVGHVINDLSNTLWFNYTLYFLTEIIELPNSQAGTIILVGQWVDAFLGPVIGILVEYECLGLGKKTPWYLLGNICNVVGIIFIFKNSPFRESIDSPTSTIDFIYYIVISTCFNAGFGLINISHIALLPNLSINRKSKDQMVRIRTAFRFIAQLMAIIISTIFFYFVKDKYLSYDLMTILCVVIGVIFTIIFMIWCRENELNKNIPKYYKVFNRMLKSNVNPTASKTNLQVIYDNILGLNQTSEPISAHSEAVDETFCYWLKDLTFYRYIVAYVMIQVSVNVTPSMIPYYMDNVLEIGKTSSGGTPVDIAIFFLVNTFGSIFSSLFIQGWLESYNSRFVLYLSCFVCTFFSCFPMIFLTSDLKNFVHVLSFFMGIGFSLAINVGSILTNDVVGNQSSKGGFVFATFGFLDRLFVGIVIFLCMAYVKDSYFLLKYFIPLFPILLLLVGMLLVKVSKVKENYEEVKDPHKNDKESELLLEHPYYSFESVDDEKREEYMNVRVKRTTSNFTL